MRTVLQPSLRRSPSLLDTYVHEFQRVLEHGQARKALRSEEALRRADALTRKIVEQSFDPVIALDESRRILMANRAAHETFGYERPALIGRAIDDVFPDLARHLPALRERSVGDRHGTEGGPTPANTPNGDLPLEGASAARQRRVIELSARTGDGRELVIEIAWSVLNEAGPARHVLIARDISALKAQEEWLRHQAQHDPLTGLPNRVQLGEALDELLAIACAERRAGDGPGSDQTALLLLDLDRFKEVNDTLGHHIGDKVLVEFTQRLLDAADEGDLVARLGGDEFAVLLPFGRGGAAAWALAERIVASMREPFVLEDGLIGEVGTSIGIALTPEHAADCNTLLQRADVAMYAAKRGVGSIALYDAQADPHSVRQLTLGGAVRHAVEEHELSLELQPQLEIRTGRIRRVEALLRWHHPTRGLISPDQFVPQSELSGLIHEITEWSMVEAVRLLRGWRHAQLDLALALNVSARSFETDDLARNLIDELNAADIEPHRLILEITETAVLETTAPAIRSLEMLHRAGIRLDVDDFGTGYSSLSLLRQLKLDELKIDKSFIAGMTTREADYLIVQSTIELAHRLGLIVVAEGVENDDQLEALRTLNCDFVQGFLVAPAMASDALEPWLAENGAA